MELSKQEMELLSPFQLLYQKSSLTKDSSFGPIIPKWFSEIELSQQEMELFLPIYIHAIFWSQKNVQFDPFPSVNHSPN